MENASRMGNAGMLVEEIQKIIILNSGTQRLGNAIILTEKYK